MNCWRCGEKLDAGTVYCSKCGADQREKPPKPPTPAPTPPAKSAKTGRKGTSWIARILIAVAVYFAARGAGYLFGSSMADSGAKSSSSAGSSYTASSSSKSSSGSSSSSGLATFAPIQDLISLNKVFRSDDGDGLTTYEIVYYGSDTGKITGMIVEYHMDKSYGYTLESVKGVQLETFFPDIATVSYRDESDIVCCCVRIDDLGKRERMQTMVDSGALSLEEGTQVPAGGVDSESYFGVLRAEGYREATYTEIGTLHFAK